MHLRDGNIIVCDCGAELNPEIITDHDFIIYDGTTATCSNCNASGAIELPTEETPVVDISPTLTELKENQLILMDAVATVFEEIIGGV